MSCSRVYNSSPDAHCVRILFAKHYTPISKSNPLNYLKKEQSNNKIKHCEELWMRSSKSSN